MNRFSPSGDNGSMQAQLQVALSTTVEESAGESIADLDARIAALKEEKDLPKTTDKRATEIQRMIRTLVVRREGIRESTRVHASELLDPRERMYRKHPTS